MQILRAVPLQETELLLQRGKELLAEALDLVEERLCLLEELVAQLAIIPGAGLLELREFLLHASDRLALLPTDLSQGITDLAQFPIDARRYGCCLVLEVRFEHLRTPTALLLEITSSGGQVSVEAKESTLELAVHRTEQDLPYLFEAGIPCFFGFHGGGLSFGLSVAWAFIRRGRRQLPGGLISFGRLVVVLRHVPALGARDMPVCFSDDESLSVASCATARPAPR